VSTHFVLELIGYLASVLIAVSLMMSSILRLRVINMIGGAAFSIYGLLIGAYPVAILNGLIVLVNIYHVVRMLRAKEYFRLLELRPGSDYLRYFLKFYAKEIHAILPDFEYRPAVKQITLFVLRDCVPAGVFIAEETEPGTWRVQLDFVLPAYRDLKIGRFLFVEQAEFFRARGVREIVVAPRTKQFGAYLAQVGFEPATRKGHATGAFRICYADGNRINPV
jgi:GNAT superfamily N-acetyltransferase